ncbi:hypothetical protein HZU67_00446 [Apis mellifera carnica]|nr:hypothetical protein HZU67_00446 [Apis mellifera carnica]
MADVVVIYANCVKTASLRDKDKSGHPVTRHADNSWFFRATFAQNFYFEPREGEEGQKKIAGQPHWRISSLISIQCRTGFNSNENAVAKGEGKKKKEKKYSTLE